MSAGCHNGRNKGTIGPAVDCNDLSNLGADTNGKFANAKAKILSAAQGKCATAGVGALLALLGRRAPEIRHLRRWLGPILAELDQPRALVAGWFAASSAGCLLAPSDTEANFRYIEVGMES